MVTINRGDRNVRGTRALPAFQKEVKDREKGYRLRGQVGSLRVKQTYLTVHVALHDQIIKFANATYAIGTVIY